MSSSIVLIVAFTYRLSGRIRIFPESTNGMNATFPLISLKSKAGTLSSAMSASPRRLTGTSSRPHSFVPMWAFDSISRWIFFPFLPSMCSLSIPASSVSPAILPAAKRLSTSSSIFLLLLKFELSLPANAISFMLMNALIVSLAFE